MGVGDVGDAGARMALPDLRRLAIGPCARTDWSQSAFEGLPLDLVKLIDEFAVQARIGAPEKHPRDALKEYDLVCQALKTVCDPATSGAYVLRTAAAGLFGVTKDFRRQFGKETGRNFCRDLLMHIFRAYGWTSPTTSLARALNGFHAFKWNFDVPLERRKVAVLDALPSIRVAINEEACEKVLLDLSAWQLRWLAGIHAAFYVHDDEVQRAFYIQKWYNVRRLDEIGNLYVLPEFLDLSYLRSTGVRAPHLQPLDNVQRWLPNLLTNGAYMFESNRFFHALGVDKWTMRNLTNAEHMFDGLMQFNGDLSKWEPSKLKNAHYMFHDCTAFEGRGLAKWAPHVTSISDAQGMFLYCRSLKLENLRGWQLTRDGVSIDSMFVGVPINESDEDHLNTMNVNIRSYVRLFSELLGREYVENINYHIAKHVFGPSHPPKIATMLQHVVGRWLAASRGA